MSYTSSQYRQMEEDEQKGQQKTIKIKKHRSDYDSETRYIAAKGHREAYEKLEREQAEYQEPETEPVKSRGFKKIKVSQYSPVPIQPKSV